MVCHLLLCFYGCCMKKFLEKNKGIFLVLGILLGVGFVYWCVLTFTPFELQCVYYSITGYACAGCGMTHFCMDLLHLDLKDAYQENLMVGILLPIWLGLLLIRLIFHPKWLKLGTKTFYVFLWSSVGLMLIFGVVRNLPGFEFLLPLSQR